MRRLRGRGGGVPGLSVFIVPVRGEAAGVVGGQGVVDVGAFGVVAGAQLAGLRVRGQGVGVGRGGVGAAAALEERADPAHAAAALAPVARRVVVGRGGAEALLLLAVAAEAELGEGGDDEEDAAVGGAGALVSGEEDWGRVGSGSRRIKG